MKRILTPALIIFLVAVLGFGIFIRLQYWSQLPVANGYAAKMMCSYHFIADREAAAIQQEDLGAPPLSLTKTVIDESAKTATTSLFGFSPRVAAYREGVGCILIDGKDDHGVSLSRPDIALRRTPDDPPIAAFSEVNGVDYGRLHRAVELAFDPSRQMDSVMTRAVVVIYKDSMIIESYAKGIDKNTELLGWSMTKSITSAMIGILIKQGQLNLDQRSLFDTWTDERSEITLRHMLQMQSGLAFEEDYATLSDATKMLFTSEDIAEIPLQSQLEYEPGTHWYYSSGTTNLLSHLIRETIGDQQAYLEFPYTELFEKLGMKSAIMETDESGLYVGSSFMYATARDWAKFGQLFLHQGYYDGQQVLDSSYVDFVRSDNGHSGGLYGGQFWLNVNHAALPDVPEDLFSCNGFQGQYVYIIPSYDAVVVRLGLANEPMFDPNLFLSRILASLKPVD